MVTGLFSQLDLGKGNAPTITVTTRDYTTSSTVRQRLASALAVALAFLALWLMSATNVSVRLGSLVSLGRIWRGFDRVDAAVVLVLGVWWIVAPAHIDDGWIWPQNRIFADLGAVTFYFDFWGVTAPLGYWPTWLGHWAIGSTSDLIVMRLPVLAVLVATWLICRACLRVALGGRLVGRSRWVLAAAFLVGSTAWGMTIRPEPTVAVLALVSLLAVLAFEHSPRTWLLAVATIAIVFAIAAHPTGVVAAAPLFGAAPVIWRTLRRGKVLLLTVAGLGLSALAVYLLLVTLGADLSHRFADAKIARTGDTHAYSAWDEYLRYTRFERATGLPLPRLSLALMLLSFGAVLTRMRSLPISVSLLPARSVGVGLALLALIPSKWPWHFGALAAITAVATAVEFERLARETEARSRVFRPLLAVAVGYCVAFLVWTEPRSDTAIGLIGLQHIAWTSGFNYFTWVAVTILGCGIVIAARSAQRRARPLSGQIAAGVAWSFVAFSALVISSTIALHVADAATRPWSPARQNLEALTGARSCGLADQLRGGSDNLQTTAAITLVHPAVGAYFPCAEIPRIRGGLVEVPTVVVAHRYWNVLERDSPFTAAAELYGLRPIPGSSYGGAEVESVTPVVPGYARADAIAVTHDMSVVG